MNAKRGFVPEDVRNFSPLALEIMRTASRHVCCLIDEGYDLKQSTTFVGNHYLLSERQHLAIMRCAATQAQIENRQKKLVPMTAQCLKRKQKEVLRIYVEKAGQASYRDKQQRAERTK